MFCLSLVPSLKQLRPRDNALVKIKIQKLLFSCLYPDTILCKNLQITLMQCYSHLSDCVFMFKPVGFLLYFLVECKLYIHYDWSFLFVLIIKQCILQNFELSLNNQKPFITWILYAFRNSILVINNMKLHTCIIKKVTSKRIWDSGVAACSFRLSVNRRAAVLCSLNVTWSLSQSDDALQPAAFDAASVNGPLRISFSCSFLLLSWSVVISMKILVQ